MPSPPNDEPPVQIIAYIKRNPSLTLAQFHTHWATIHAPRIAPWAEHYGVLSYKQIHTSGTIPYTPTAVSDSYTTSADPAPGTPLPFDGIALWTLASLPRFLAGAADPYFTTHVKDDEKRLLDTEGVGGGVVATFLGPVVCVVEGSRSVLGEGEGVRDREVWAACGGRRGDV